jgi:hypothetical protein
LPEDEQLKILGELEKRESDFTRLQRARLTSDDFEPLTIIGRGAFGEVSWRVLVCAYGPEEGGGLRACQAGDSSQEYGGAHSPR